MAKQEKMIDIIPTERGLIVDRKQVFSGTYSFPESEARRRVALGYATYANFEEATGGMQPKDATGIVRISATEHAKKLAAEAEKRAKDNSTDTTKPAVTGTTAGSGPATTTTTKKDGE